MWRRKTTGVAALALGVVLVIAGLVDHAFAAPKAALCQSDLGQLGQAFDNRVAHDCGLVTTLETAVGWLLVGGVLIAVLGTAVLYNSRTAARLATPGTPPARQAPPPGQPSSPPAERSWWTQT